MRVDSLRKMITSGRYNFSEVSFDTLMQNRIYKVLIICSNYDYFMLEEDGRVDEQVFAEYVSLNLREPPVFLQADNSEKALAILAKGGIDLIITMLSAEAHDAVDLAKRIKVSYPRIPIVVLTPFSREISLKVHQADLSAIDYVFSWLGNAGILLVIIKLIEDKMNLAYDVEVVGVQTILLVEDSIRFYSAYLPVMYKILLKQARAFMTEGLNDHKEMLLMRGRPKILLATTYEQAIELVDKYSDNMLGVISDVAYSREGQKDAEAGVRLYDYILRKDKHIQFIMQSSDADNEEYCQWRGIDFLNKNSNTLSLQLADFMFQKMAFGDFVFRNGTTGEELTRATDLQELQKIILNLPLDSLQYHFNRNDFSRWLNARAFFQVAEMFKPLMLDDFPSREEARLFIYETISNFRLNRSRGVIAKFDKNSYDEYLIFSRIGSGSLGGKARGLAFIDSFLKRNADCQKYDDILITIPRTVVLSTDIFDEFMETNQLYFTALSNDYTDDYILQRFVNAKLPMRIYKDLAAFLKVTQNPIAVRSSSVLEDSLYQPFAGIYSTYMIPRIKDDPTKMVHLLAKAIKSVYASVYYRSSKAYMEATANLIDEEKMGIILQEVCGTEYGDRFYPHISGVARSINFYPIPPEKSEEGIVKLGLGLGKIIVEGGVTLRMSPVYPKKNIQTSSPQMALKNTQKYFYALDLRPEKFTVSTDDSVNLLKLPIREAEKDNTLRHIASTYDLQNQIMRDGINYKGKKVITFANILKNETFPLAEILQKLLKVGQKEMNTPIEIEFAVNLNIGQKKPSVFNFLQIRPIVENYEDVSFDIDQYTAETLLLQSKQALGNGTVKNIRDFVYVKPEVFKAANNIKIAERIAEINEQFVAQKRYYILAGPGRWGSSDPWLGIPVKWPQISAARLIVEAGLDNYRIDPSQGTHFFQNLTSFRVGYFTINPYANDGFYDTEYLNAQTAIYEDEYIRHICFAHDLVIKIDGKHNKGVVCKPVA